MIFADEFNEDEIYIYIYIPDQVGYKEKQKKTKCQIQWIFLSFGNILISEKKKDYLHG